MPAAHRAGRSRLAELCRPRRDGKASALGPWSHRVPDLAAAALEAQMSPSCGEQACVSVCHLPSHLWKPQSWADSLVQDALGAPARREPGCASLDVVMWPADRDFFF